MFIFQSEGQEYAVRPMNCPGHIYVYKSQIRSYKDLPLRYFELGSVYRNEKSGVLHGLLRVRGFTQDDAHIFCSEDQLKDEIVGVINFVFDTMKDFGFNEYFIELSTRPEKAIGTDQMWEHATDALKEALKKKGLKYDIHEGEGAFYGPKIDIKLKDAIGRSWQCATIQCDFALPERFDLTYVDENGNQKRPVMIHRVLLGSIERFIGTLLEHYGGALPAWLAPVQAVIIPVSDKFNDYAEKIKNTLLQKTIRSQVNIKNETLGKKIRQAQMEKVPYMLIVGEKEKKNGKVALRSRAQGDEGTIDLDKLVERVRKEVNNKQ